MVINTNVSAQSSARLLSESSTLLSKSLARLSSGSKIVSPEDDAAGLAVSTRFDAQVNRITAANNNVNNAISFSQTQDGFLKKVGKALDRMSELSVLSQDVTKQDEDRDLYDAEFQTLKAYITDVAKKEFNGVSLFDGTSQGVTKDEDGNKYNMTAVDLTSGAVNTAATSGDIKTTTTAATALHHPAREGPRERRREHRPAHVHQRAVGHPEGQPLRREQPHQGRRCGGGKHPICPVQHPRPGRHGDASPGKRQSAIGAPVAVVIEATENGLRDPAGRKPAG
jgi:flagellin-like hook-associated protein FlgL